MIRSVYESLRQSMSSNLVTAHLSNRFFGVIGDRQYKSLCDRSELIDGIADVTPILQLRDTFRGSDRKPRFPDRVDSNNRMYGIKSVLFGDRCREFSAPAIEHGLFLGDFVIPADTVETGAPAVATFGSYRKEVIQTRQDVPVFEVGPYINYAKTHYGTAQLQELKNQLGRTLLVYVSHSTWDAQVERSADPFAWIEEFASEFDSVIVSVFWWDLEEEFLAQLTAKGYLVTSCGLMHDRNFLARQKTLLALADLAIGDGVGTHSGYCLHEDVPYRFVDVNTKVSLNQEASRDSKRFGTRERAEVLEAVKDLFRDSELPAQEMRSVQLLNDLWGFDSVRSAAEIEGILDVSREISRLSVGRRSRSVRALEKLNARTSESDTKRRIIEQGFRK